MASSIWHEVGTCPVVHKVMEPEDCGLKIDDALASRVVDFMENETFGNSFGNFCRSEWPNPTAITSDEMCKSDAELKVARVYIFGLVVACAVLWL